jgi:hypothetical protein
MHGILEDVADLATACVGALAVEVSLQTEGLLKTLDLIERRTAHVKPPAGVVRGSIEAIDRAYRLLPIPATCLRRALLEYWLLRRSGIIVEFVIGVKRGAEIEAHAWVESDLGPTRCDADHGAYAEILRSPRPTGAERL